LVSHSTLAKLTVTASGIGQIAFCDPPDATFGSAREGAASFIIVLLLCHSEAGEARRGTSLILFDYAKDREHDAIPSARSLTV
jgi:hypothetical protein